MNYNAEKFAADLRLQNDLEFPSVLRAALTATSGKHPPKDAAERVAWFNGLSESDKDMVIEVAKWAGSLAIFGILNVLDGSDVISEELSELRLTLSVSDGETSEVLSDSQDYKGLHELF